MEFRTEDVSSIARPMRFRTENVASVVAPNLLIPAFPNPALRSAFHLSCSPSRSCVIHYGLQFCQRGKDVCFFSWEHRTVCAFILSDRSLLSERTFCLAFAVSLLESLKSNLTDIFNCQHFPASAICHIPDSSRVGRVCFVR